MIIVVNKHTDEFIGVFSLLPALCGELNLPYDKVRRLSWNNKDAYSKKTYEGYLLIRMKYGLYNKNYING